MSLKLSRLKTWLSLDDAATYLSLLIEEPVVTEDLLQLGLQGDITLSMLLVNSHYAHVGPMIPIQDATLYKSRPLNELLEGKAMEEITGREKQVILQVLAGRVSEDYDLPHPASNVRVVYKGVTTGDSPAPFTVHFKGQPLPDYSGVLMFNKEDITTISGLWDLSLIGAERVDVEEAFYGKLGGPTVKWAPLTGPILKHPTANRWANLQQRFDDKYCSPGMDNFYPSEGLPHGELLVIRSNELQRFAGTLENLEAGTGALLSDEDTNLSRLRTTQRILAALTVGLANRHNTYRRGAKPNIKALADVATDHLRDSNGRAQHGFSERTARDAISNALKSSPDLADHFNDD